MKKLLFLLVWVGWVFGQGNLGQAGANFLQIAVEPRGAALGGAATATSSGASASTWNPAALASVISPAITIAHTRWFLDTRLTYLAGAARIGGWGTLGATVAAFTMPDLEVTTVYENEGTGEQFSAGDLAVGLSFGRWMSDRYAFGGSVKYVREGIWNESASQIAFDLGSIYRSDWKGFTIGMTMQNYGGKMEFSGKDVDGWKAAADSLSGDPRSERLAYAFRLPQFFRLGVSLDALASGAWRSVAILEVEMPSDNVEQVVVATETSWNRAVFLRAAYRYNSDLAPLSFGAGAAIPFADRGVSLAYAFTPYSLFGGVHRIGVDLTL